MAALVADCSCEQCSSDSAWLKCRVPGGSTQGPKLRSADLFAGGGGLSLGLARAATELGAQLSVELAIESDEGTARTLDQNLAPEHLVIGRVEETFGGALGSRFLSSERKIRDAHGGIDLLVGGPPCQGFSSLNNRTRHRDTRNRLYTRMARAAEVLRPRAVLIENVPGVERDATGAVAATLGHLRAIGYHVLAKTVDMSRLGVPQRRKRFVVVALDRQVDRRDPVEEAILRWSGHLPRTVSWAIGDLVPIAGASPFDSPSRMSTQNVDRATWLLANDAYELPNYMRPPCHRGDHSYVSMYGRLAWDRPAQTITSGFGSMGQGRHVHPLQPRVLTPHEAARLQTFPDSFMFPQTVTRTRLAEVIGNAAPPLFNAAVGKELLPMLL